MSGNLDEWPQSMSLVLRLSTLRAKIIEWFHSTKGYKCAISSYGIYLKERIEAVGKQDEKYHKLK